MSKFLEKIFSVTNSNDKRHKVCRILGLKLKFKNKKDQKLNKNMKYEIKNLGENNQIFFLNKDNKKELMGKFAPIPIEIFGNNNLCVIPKDVNWLNSKIIIKSNNSSFIMKNTKDYIVSFCIEINHGDNQEIFIDENFSMGGGYMYAIEKNSKIKIGKDCMFSTDICIMSSDGHTIRDKDTKNIINYANEIIIGNHVWFGKYAKVIKNSLIPDNSIVAINSLVNKKFDKPNIILAGNPAKVVKEDIEWERTALSVYKE